MEFRDLPPTERRLLGLSLWVWIVAAGAAAACHVALTLQGYA